MAPTEAFQVIGGMKAGHLGTGVSVDGYRRIRDAFLDLQYRAQAMQVGDQETRSTQLDQVELVLSEPGENGIANQLAKFWSGWGDVANAPRLSGRASTRVGVTRGRRVGSRLFPGRHARHGRRRARSGHVCEK